MAGFVIYAVFLVSVPMVYSLPEVDELSGEADFRSIRLHWKYNKTVSGLDHFTITYCEDQSWGKYRCKKQQMEDTDANEVDSQDERYREFETAVSGLRMATNYTMEVTPVIQGLESDRGRALGTEIIIRTKGFSARATKCLANSSVVEVETGPNFGGKISVEGTDDPRCRTAGDRGSLQTSYLLNIDHELCGSQLQNTSVLTFIIVQENLPILTHSTRRFLVMCNYVPETFTVRAGVNLPEDINSVGDELSPVDQSIFEVDPSELFDSSNNIFDSRIAQDVGRALKMSAGEKDKEPRMWAHLVLMVILVMAAVVGLSCAVWHFVRHARASNRQGFMSPQEEPRAIEETSSMEAVVRDYTHGDTAPACVENPVALLQTSYLTGQPTVLDDIMFDFRENDPRVDLEVNALCRPPSVFDIQINDSIDGLTELGLDDISQLSVHNLSFGTDLPRSPSLFDLNLDPAVSVLDLGNENYSLELENPVETVNPLSLLLTQQGQDMSMTLDQFEVLNRPPSAFADDYPVPDIYHSPNSSILVLDPLALHHQSMIHLPNPQVLEDDLMIVGPRHPPLSLQHVSQSYFDDDLPAHIMLEDVEDEVFESIGSSRDDGNFQGEFREDSSEDNDFDIHLNDSDRERAISRHPSLDQNWKLGDGEGQIFPAFSQ